MVQLSPSPCRDLSPSDSSSKSMKPAKEPTRQKGESQPTLSPLQATLSSSATPFQLYETYIDNGMICLKHKIRNIEKKKIKLEDYKQRRQNGETLNQDQLEAVEKYDEVVHNLEFAKELQKTFSALGQELLKAQRKAQKREAIMKFELDRKKLRTILHAQYVLKFLRLDHVQKDFREGRNGASYLSSRELDYLVKFSKLAVSERDVRMGLEDQMDKTALYFWELLEGSEKTVAGTTYKQVKNLLSPLLDGGYFENIPAPPVVKERHVEEVVLKRPERHVEVLKRQERHVEETVLKRPERHMEEEELRDPERTESFSKLEPVKEPESPDGYLQSHDKHPCEFLNRRYLLETEHFKDPEEPKSWEAGFIRKQQQSPKPWEMQIEKQQNEQKEQPSPQMQPTPKPWGAASLVPKEQPGMQKCEMEPQRQPSPKAWGAASLVPKEQPGMQKCEMEPQRQPSPKAWGAASLVPKEQPGMQKCEMEPQRQPSPKAWGAASLVPKEQPGMQKCEMEPQRQPSPKAWGATSLVPKEQPGMQKCEMEPQRQPSPKAWGAASLVPKEQPGMQKCEMEPQRQPSPKAWGAASLVPKEQPGMQKCEMEPQRQPSPKAWGATSLVPKEQPGMQKCEMEPQRQPSPKAWGAASLVPKEQPGMQKCEIEPKEKRERKHKVEPEVKNDGKALEENGGQVFDALRKTGLLSENHKLPAIVQTSIQLPKPGHQPAAEFCSTSTLPQDPIQRRQKLQDLMAQMQGTYNFMQESVLDYDLASHSAVPASNQPFTSTSLEQAESNSTDYLPQPVQVNMFQISSSKPLRGSNDDALTTTDESLSGSETNLSLSPPAQEEIPLTPAKEPENYASPQPKYKENTHLSEHLVQKDSMDIQATAPSPSQQQSPVSTSKSSMSPVSQEKAFQCSPVNSTSVAINTAPFRTMQTVFKVDAPLPPRKESDIKDESAFTTGYNQTFTTSSTQTLPQYIQQPNAEQNSISQEALPAASTSQPDGTVPVNNLTFYPAQTNAFPRATQPYANNRGLVRGVPRGGRAMANSYRSPSGYKGFDTYRGGSPAVINGNFAQAPYSAIPYTLRDGNYQPCYKRGACGPRVNSRGWSDSSQVSSPERDHEAFHSGDSGQGDSRSLTPVDMPVTSQAATILPVHVYPLPQQMRVAFSTARTSNFAPGTLDQPIVFDLLLNNLGETFDIQLGRFTCPVNGTYVFIFHMLKLAVNVPLYVNLMKNEEVLVSAYANDGAPDHETASNHAILQLFQGDQIWLRLHRGAIYGSSWKYSTFSGYLLYQD
ncbi:caprin-2 isoform X2 [Rhinatrema bivittatum]|uniref:caprin-2 isoform X2 n=1 Tax=Rhinatrema bivittatum TaxID=194408 RepID=UPI001128C360|nr:caprin-2 isoform X2 [Rhinatrema bivittatum]